MDEKEAMFSTLEDFLAIEDVTSIRKAVKVQNGDRRLTIEIRPLTSAEYSDIQKKCRSISANKSGAASVSFDSAKYNLMVAERCITNPNIRKSEFLKSAGCVSGMEFLSRKFRPGAINAIADEIQEISGFVDEVTEVEEAKN